MPDQANKVETLQSGPSLALFISYYFIVSLLLIRTHFADEMLSPPRIRHLRETREHQTDWANCAGYFLPEDFTVL